MKKILSLSLTFMCLCAPSAFCDAKVDAKNWQTRGKFDPAMLSETLGDHAGQFVAVQFNFRGKDIHHMKPNWYEGSIWQRDPTAKKGFSNVRVLLAKKDVETFKSITTDATSRTRLILYGRVESDADSHFYFVRLLGRKATVDSSGNASVAW
jgi:hypothetical protein